METEIRDRLVSYLLEEVSLDELQQWLIPATWDIDEHLAPSAANLAFSTQLLLSERMLGHLDERAFRAGLQGLLETGLFGTPVVTKTASGASTQQAQWALRQVAWAGR